jgi:hypothetical protein
MSRWLDQGATQGLVVATAPSRHLAGMLEVQLGRRVSDRTDWRALLSGDTPPVDLAALRRSLQPAPAELPQGVRWHDDQPVTTLAYPVLGYPRRLVQLTLDRVRVVSGRLMGIKGQYLLFEHGVLNVRRHRAYHVGISVHLADDATSLSPDLPQASQMELFR